MTELLYRDEVYAVVGTAMEVYDQLGPGFLEAVYQEALEMELAERGIPFVSQKELRILYKGQPLKKTYISDLTGCEKIIVELKASDRLTGKDTAQLLNYPKATGLRVGLLVNFGNAEKLEWERQIK